MDQHGESCCAVSHSFLVTRSEPQETEQMLETHECVLISFSHCLMLMGKKISLLAVTKKLQKPWFNANLVTKVIGKFKFVKNVKRNLNMRF